MSGPIRPDEVPARPIPDAVFDAFNELIAASFDGHKATLTQDAVVQRVIIKMGVTREHVFRDGWLDVEPSYRAAGWTVVYDKPGYNEDYPATFTFVRAGK